MKVRQFYYEGATKKPLTAGCFFLLLYAIGQFIIAAFEIQAPTYGLYTFENAQHVLFVSLSIFFAALLQKNHAICFRISVNQSRLVTIFFPLLLVTLILCYLFPWGILGQELGIGHSIKALFRHAYAVISLILMITRRRLLLLLFGIDVLMVLLDPSRVFFVETIFPKLYFCYLVAPSAQKWRLLFLGALAILLLMFIQSLRLNEVGLDFIAFALYSDIMHATYPALQLSQLSIDFPWAGWLMTEDFYTIYGENFSPLGGYFFPGTFLVSGKIFIDCISSFICSFLIFKLFTTFSKNRLNAILFSGVIVLFQKFPLLNSVKLVIALLFFSWFFSRIGVFRIKTMRLARKQTIPDEPASQAPVVAI